MAVPEVEVDEARDGDEVRDALDTLAQRVVGDAERVEHARLLVHDLQQAVVRDDDERVDFLGQEVDALIGLVAAGATLERERLGDDAHRQRADLLAGDLGDDGRRARSGSAALAGRDEHHVRLGERLADLRATFLGRLAAHFGVRAGAQAARELFADVDRLVGVRHEQSLSIRVHGDELDSSHARFDHAVHGIRAAATDADDLDDRQMLGTYLVWHCILHTCCVFKCCVSRQGTVHVRLLYTMLNHLQITLR